MDATRPEARAHRESDGMPGRSGPASIRAMQQEEMMHAFRRFLVTTFALLVVAGAAAPASASLDDPDRVFCAPIATTVAELSTDEAAGVEWSSSVIAPLTAEPGQSRFNIGIYVHNLGPGPITFASPAFSVHGTTIPFNTWTTIPLTPTGSSASFWDGSWGDTFAEGVDIVGCTSIAGAVTVAKANHNHATAHLDLSFWRGDTLHTVRVNVHFS